MALNNSVTSQKIVVHKSILRIKVPKCSENAREIIKKEAERTEQIERRDES